MSEKNLETAIAYYTAMNNKDITTLSQYLHTEIEFRSPLQRVNEKEKVVEAIKRFMSAFESVNVRAKFNAKTQVMLSYEVKFPQPIGEVRTAVLMGFKDELISYIELFFDASPFKN